MARRVHKSHRARIAARRQHTADTRKAMGKISARVWEQSKRLDAIGLVPATTVEDYLLENHGIPAVG